MGEKLLKARTNASNTFENGPLQCTTTPCQQEGTLEIIIREERSQEGVADAQVTISGPEHKKGRTNQHGSIIFSSLPPGNYSINITEEEIDTLPNNTMAVVDSQQHTTVRLDTKRRLRTVKLKRKHIDWGAEDKYGHWWVEIAAFEGQTMSEQQSYGWWPANGVGIWDTLAGTDGVLNGKGHFRGTDTQDPHHGDDAEEEIHPYIRSGASANSTKNCMRFFAKNYSGEWRWTLGWGQNCHTFQKEMLKHCNLSTN